MKTFTIGAAAALFSVMSANAADIAKPVYNAPPVVAAFNWTGFYLGGHAGGAWSDFNAFWNPLPNPVAFEANPQSANLKDSAFIGGVHAGYNWQAHNWVYGIEGDWSWTDLSKNTSATWVNPIGIITAPDSLTTLGGAFNWLASARGRLGYLVTPQLLIYATGGGAWADVNYNASAVRPGNGYSAIISASDTVSGWVVGGGAEWMLTNNWLLRAEYLYYNFSSSLSAVAPSSAFPAFPSSFGWNDATVQVVRGGITYKFDWGKAPVVANY